MDLRSQDLSVSVKIINVVYGTSIDNIDDLRTLWLIKILSPVWNFKILQHLTEKHF